MAARKRGLSRLGLSTDLEKKSSAPSVPPWLTYVSAFLLLVVITQLIADHERRPVWRI